MEKIEYKFSASEVGDLFQIEDSFLASISNVKHLKNINTVYSLGVPYVDLRGKFGIDYHLLIELTIDKGHE